MRILPYSLVTAAILAATGGSAHAGPVRYVAVVAVRVTAPFASRFNIYEWRLASYARLNFERVGKKTAGALAKASDEKVLMKGHTLRKETQLARDSSEFDSLKFDGVLKDSTAEAKLNPALNGTVGEAGVPTPILAVARAGTEKAAVALEGASTRSITFNPLSGELKFSDFGKYSTPSWKFSLEGKANMYLLGGSTGAAAYYCRDGECLRTIAIEGADDLFSLKKLIDIFRKGNERPRSPVQMRPISPWDI